MAKHLTPVNLALAFLLLAVAARAYSAGEMATLWLVAIGYVGGLVSGVLVTMTILERE